jgi:hypothetical protein
VHGARPPRRAAADVFRAPPPVAPMASALPAIVAVGSERAEVELSASSAVIASAVALEFALVRAARPRRVGLAAAGRGKWVREVGGQDRRPAGLGAHTGRCRCPCCTSPRRLRRRCPRLRSSHERQAGGAIQGAPRARGYRSPPSYSAASRRASPCVFTTCAEPS